VVPVGDLPGHALGLHFKCQWTTPIQLGSDASQDGEDVELVEISGNTARASSADGVKCDIEGAYDIQVSRWVKIHPAKQ
jgi:hypothetical protein